MQIKEEKGSALIRSMSAYERFSEIYDEMMEDLPYDLWADYVINVLKDRGITEGLVCELGCGTGRMTGRLADAGYDMIGIDLSSDMLEEAMLKEDGTRPLPILYLHQDIRSFELYGTVKAVVSFCDTINYLLSKEDLQETFCLAYMYLDPEGMFYFDVKTPYCFEYVLGETTQILEEDDLFVAWDNHYEAKERLSEYELTMFFGGEDGLFEKEKEYHTQKAYLREEIEEALKKAGFTLLSVVDGEDMGEVKEESLRWGFLAKKE